MDCRTQLASMAGDELDRGDFLMATRILNTSIILEPDNWKLYLDRSICLRNLGRYQESLNDANSAIRLNPSDHELHYQKGLALISLSLLPEAVTSFKKAIELRAKQEETRLSDIFKLLRGALEEMDAARKLRKSSATCSNPSGAGETSPRTAPTTSALPTTPANPSAKSIRSMSPSDKDLADGASERDIESRPAEQDNEQKNFRVEAVIQNGNSASKINTNLVSECNRNNQKPCANQSSSETSCATSSSAPPASQCNLVKPESNSASLPASSYPSVRDANSLPNREAPLNGGQHQCEPSKSSTSSSYDWNIRRSERIFLHGSSEPGTVGTHHDSNGHEITASSKLKASSRASSAGSSRGQKRPTEHTRDPYQPSRATKSKTATSSHVDSDIDVDDSNCDNSQSNYDLNANSKRVMIAPSSSMPATSQPSITAKEDSYSSKYKRLRRDRERARRGTSKLCTIKTGDLEELRKSGNSMRVIAPIDGWLYSGQLSIDGSFDDGLPQYVVKLDGDSSGSSFLFTESTVLNDVIKEVKVKSVSELRKGARICCYWSRTYKCLSTGVVTSRTFEEKKSLVSVKYDNGDLSALPLEDLRMLPPDYPKYMSNCDPLLLAKSGDTEEGNSSLNSNNRIVVNGKSTISPENITYFNAANNSNEITSCDDTDVQVPVQEEDLHHAIETSSDASQLGDPIIPTNQAIEFLTRDDEEMHHLSESAEARSHEPPEHHINRMHGLTSRTSSEENNFGIEYRPWVPEGTPRRTKRNGRTYRDNYPAIRRGHEVIKVGDSAELMPRDESILPFIAKIDGIWTTSRGEMRVRVRWYYRLVETQGSPYELEDGDNALFETDHLDENDVQSIWRATKILSWTNYRRDYLGHVNKASDGPKIFYLAGYYDPCKCIKHLRSDVTK